MELQGAMIRLQEATTNGNVASLLQLLSEYPKILDFERCYFKQSALNVALKLGHLDFAKRILVEQPELAKALTIDDSPSSCTSALHICSEKGYVEMVQLLLQNSYASRMCLAHDSDGRNPVHLAAIEGHHEVLRVLIEAMPMAAKEHTSQSDGGETVLHLCVKYRQFETLKFLIDEMNFGDLLNSTDIYGNTALHLAVASKQSQMVEYLVKKKGIDINATNTNGLTAMDICTKSTKDEKHDDIWRTLVLCSASNSKGLSENKYDYWLKNERDGIMVVASLMATMAFQLAVNPPGGVWQDNEDGHVAGESILLYQKEDLYDMLTDANNGGFMLSVMVILLAMFPVTAHSNLFQFIVRLSMSLAIVATYFSYSLSSAALDDGRDDRGNTTVVLLPSYFNWLFILTFISYILTHIPFRDGLRRARVLFSTTRSTSSSVV